MASASSLYGVMKWLRRDEWNEAFSDLLEKHLRPACSKWDVEIDELSSVIGDDWFMNLWGCAFEDFLTREFADNRNIVDDYLKKAGLEGKRYQQSLHGRAAVVGDEPL
jgi:hypothetical protein